MFSVAPILSLEAPFGSEAFEKKLEKLKSISGILKSSPPARDALPWTEAGTAVPRGALTEVSGPAGSGKTEAVLKFLAAHTAPLGRVAWIEDRFTAFPTGFSQHGVDLSRLLFIEGGKDSIWAAHQILRSQIFGALILFVRESTLSASQPQIELRRLQLSAEQSHAAVILLTHQPRPQGASWPISLQLRMDARTRKMEILKSGKNKTPSRLIQAV